MIADNLAGLLALARTIPLPVLCAISIACQLLAIICFVEKMKAVDAGEPRTLEVMRDRRTQERRSRAAFGLCIDLSLYLLALEIVAAFVALGR